MNAKIYNGNVQPNPKEFKIWVNDEGVIKTWNGTEWIEQSGGSGESGGSGSDSSGSEDNHTYLDIRNYPEEYKWILVTNSFICAFQDDDEIKYLTSYNVYDYNGDSEDILRVKAVCIDFNLKTHCFNDGITKTIKEVILMETPEAELDAIPRITKEQFYSLE